MNIILRLHRIKAIKLSTKESQSTGYNEDKMKIKTCKAFTMCPPKST